MTNKTKINKHLKALFLTLIIFTIVGSIIYVQYTRGGEKNAEAAWYASTGWNYRKQLIIDATKVSGTTNLTNFPVLVSRTDNDLKANAQSDGDDILFTSSDGITKLDHEIETYTTATGELVAWVEIPTLDYDDDTAIYMYYGNSSATSQQNVSGTWASNYSAIWHLHEDPSTSATAVRESTTNSNDGDATSTMTSADVVSGIIGNALDFDGGEGDYVVLENGNAYDALSQGAISAWVNIKADLSGFHDLFSSGPSPNWLEFGVYNGEFHVWSSDGLRGLANTTPLSLNQWYHVAYVVSGSGNAFYVNGIPQSVTYETGNSTSTTFFDDESGATEYNIGRTVGFSSEDHNGFLDELRIANTPYSADWIATEYSNQNSPTNFFKSISNPQSESQAQQNPELAYSFDEGYGTTLSSTGSNKHTGTISGATWQTENLCLSAKCLYFDGTNDVVTTSGTTSNVNTVSFWVRPMTTTEQLVDLNGTASISVSSGTISATSLTSPTIYVDGKESSTLTANRWQHVVVTTGTGLSASALKLGQISSNYGQMFMDEFQVYTTQLSDTQVKSLYNSRGGNLTAAQMGAYDQKMLSNGLVGYWNLDETSTGGGAVTRNDTSGNGFSAADTNTTASGGGKFGLSADFESTNSESLDTSDNNALDVTTFTLAAWVKMESFTGGGSNFSANILSKDQAYYLALDGNNATNSNLDCAINNGSSTDYFYPTLANRFTTGTWYHVACTLGDGYIRLYINGQQIYEESTTFTPTNSGSGIRIGGTIDNYFDGTIDETRIYNRTLSSSEIQQLYNWAPGPVGYWKMDEKTGSTAYDSSGNNLTGTLTNNPTYSTGKYGSSILFDGTDDRVEVADNNILDITSSLTLSTWAYLTSDTNDYKSVICKGNSFEYCLTIFDNETINVTIDGGVGACTSTAAVPINSWSYISGVFDDQANTITIYLNGASVGYCTGVTASPGTNSEELDLGVYDDSGGSFVEFFPGRLDDIKIYNYARTTSQIIQDMNANHPVVGTPVAGPVAHWSFDEGYGTTANDQTPNNLDLTLSSPSWTNNGKLNKAWNGDGTTYLSNNHSTAFTFESGDSFAITMWAKSDNASNPAESELLVDKLDYTWGGGYSLSFGTDGKVYCEIDDDATAFPEDTTSSSQDYYDATWHHIACILDRSTSNLSLYVDGKKVSEDSSVSSTGQIGSSELYVGNDNSGANYEFTGDIDELKIYRAALTATDVLAEYNQGKSLVLGSLSTESNGTTPSNSASREYCVPGDTNSCSSPVAEWKFDELTGSSVFDTSTNNYTGTFSGNTLFSTGKIGSAVVFDGDSDHINFGDILDFADGDALSISLWFMPTADTQQSFLLSHKANADSANPGFGINWFHTSFGGNTCLYLSDGFSNGADQYEVCTPDNSTNIMNRWYHLEAVYNNTDLTGSRIYLDGVEYNDYEACVNCASVSEIGTPANTEALCIGSNGNGLGGCNTNLEFTGKIDQVRIYNYARTPAQVAWDYNKGAPIAHWQFDEISGTIAYDNSGNGLSGTLTNSPTRTTSGKFNSAITFANTTTQQINMGSPAALDDITTKSVCAWIKPSSYGNSTDDSNIVSKADNLSWYAFLGDDHSAVQTLYFVQTFNAGAGNGAWRAPANAITLNVWQHICIIYDNSSTANDPTMYINGISRQITEISGPSGTRDSDASNSLLIGNFTPGYTGSFDGTLDDVRIYNYALTLEQIRLIMNDNSALRF